MNIDIDNLPISKAELARELGVSRTYVTLLAQGKRNPSKRIVDRLTQLQLTANVSANTGTHEHLTFNQGVTGSRPVRPTKASRPSLPGSFKKNQGVKTLGQPTP